jgi:hypothetical protein
MTAEQRQLLEGDGKRAARKLPLLGYGDATSAPPRFAARIVEIRQAILDGRAIPPPSAEYRAAAERAQTVEKRLFPTRANQPVTQTPNRVDTLRRSLDALSIF